MKLVKILLLFVIIFCLFLFSCQQHQSQRLTQERCYIEDIDEEVICGTYLVRENRQEVGGREIALNFIILPARNANKAPDPVFCFDGGPGCGAANHAYIWADMFEKLRQERDIVLVDQRGTGDSNRLYCPPIGDVNSAQTYLNDMYTENYLRNCRRLLEKKADLRYYHNSIAMDDIDELRAALGYEQINVTGGSTGSRAGYVYMKRHPGRVRSAFLWAICPTNKKIPSTLAQDTETALERLFADCAADPDCAADYPDLRQEFYQVLNQLKTGPVTVTITNPITRQPETVTFRHHNFITGVRNLLYFNSGARWLPVFIHCAYRDVYFPIVETIVDWMHWIHYDIMQGVTLCVRCTEDFPYVDVEEARARAQGTFMGTYRLDQQAKSCELWVRGQLPDGFHELVPLNIPTLIVSGENDPATPPYYGERLAESLPDSLHVIIPNSAHGTGDVWKNCLDEVVAQFISRGSFVGLDFTCVYKNKRPPFVSWRDYTGQKLVSNILKKIFHLAENINCRKFWGLFLPSAVIK